MTRTAPAAILATAALALCGGCATAHDDPAPAPTTRTASANATGRPRPTTAPTTGTPPVRDDTCLAEDHNLAPGGYCLYPAKVTWPDWQTLPVDPATLDWADPDAVATAYTITLGTWDSTIDGSAAHATHRAAIFTTTGRTDPDTTDPDTARGQAEYTTTSAAGGHTTVTVHDVTTEGPDPEPLQPDGTWRRVITYTRTVRTRSPETETSRRTGALYLTLAASPDTGQWLITRATATAEYDAAQTD